MTDQPPEPPATPDAATSARVRSAEEIGRGRELALLLACHLESYRPDERLEALNLAFESAQRSAGIEDSAGAQIAHLAKDATVAREARRRLERLIADWAQVDQTIESVSDKWRLDRMHHIERNIIRLALVEMRAENTKAAVLNAEAVRLANRFGSEQASRFVNGIVDALVSHLQA